MKVELGQYLVEVEGGQCLVEVEASQYLVQVEGGQQGRIQDFKLGGAPQKNCAEQRETRKCLGYFV